MRATVFAKSFHLDSFRRQSLLAGDRESIKAGPLMVLGQALRFDQTFTPKPVKGCVKTAVLDLKALTRARADRLTDSVAVLLLPLKRSTNQRIQGRL